MGLLGSKLFWGSLLGLLASAGLLVLGVGYLALVVYSGLVTGTPVVGVLVDVAVPALAGFALLVVLLVGSVVGLALSVVRHASLPRSERVAALAERAEREYPALGALGLSDLLSPPEPSADERAERALADLKRRYVEGDLTEDEFERKVDRLVAADSIDAARADRERRRVVEDDPEDR
jgi:uncharacterized membrane protein